MDLLMSDDGRFSRFVPGFLHPYVQKRWVKTELHAGRNGSIFQSFLHASLAFIATRAKKTTS